MTEPRFISPRYFKPSTFVSLALFISAGAHGRVLLPDESATVVQADTPESWTMATGSTLTVDSGAQVLDISGGGGPSTLNLNPGSSAQRINLNAGSKANITGASIVSNIAAPAFQIDDASATFNNSTLISTNNIGILGAQAADGPGSSFVINGGSISGAVGGISLSAASTLNAAGTVITGSGANSYGIQAFSSNMTLQDSTVTGVLNGIRYRGNVGTTGTVNLVATHVEGSILQQQHREPYL